MTDMNHMRHIRDIALGDAAVLEKKEGTYKGSWKKSGGRSAWFMAKRNLDRLMNMMAYVPFYVSQEHIDTERNLVTVNASDLKATLRSEDIFAAIEADPSGADGTVLAVIRDARRYFTLVEAEMVARGLVQVEGKPENVVTLPTVISPGQSIVIENKSPIPLTVVSRERMEEVSTGGHSPPVYTTNTRRPGESDEEALKRTERGLPDTPSCGDGTFDARARRATEELEERSRTPENGGQHTSLVPWAVSLQWRYRKNLEPDKHGKNAIFDNWWKQQAAGLWVLEAAVPTYAGTVPAIVSHLYTTMGDYRVIMVSLCPDDARDWFPRLRRELNTKELEEQPEWQRGMYRWTETGNKWVMEPQHLYWARD